MAMQQLGRKISSKCCSSAAGFGASFFRVGGEGIAAMASPPARAAPARHFCSEVPASSKKGRRQAYIEFLAFNNKVVLFSLAGGAFGIACKEIWWRWWGGAEDSMDGGDHGDYGVSTR